MPYVRRMVLEIIGILFLLIGFFLFLGAIALPLIIFVNPGDIGGKLSPYYPSVPGFRSNTRWKQVVATFGYLFIISFLLMGVGVGLSPSDADAPAPSNPGADATPTPLVDEMTDTDADAAATPSDEATDESESQTESPPSDSTAEPDMESPTASPSPTMSPSPTASPTASPTPKPQKAPDGESFSMSGSGTKATETFTTEGGLVVFDFSHNGDSNFAVWLLNENGEREELLVNTIGSWDGKVALYLPAGTYLFDIDADGRWEADVTQPRYSAAEVGSLPASESGDDSTYIGPIELEGLTRISFTAEDDEHYAVWLKNHHGQDIDLLFNEIGPFEGSTAIGQNGVAIIQVDTNGNWKLVIEKG